MDNICHTHKKGLFLISTLLILLFSSCASRRNIVLLRDIDNARTLANTETYNMKIAKDDKLSIVVSCGDLEVSAPYNTPMTALYQQGVGGMTQDGPSGYIVDRNGCIDFPTLGRLKVEGMTRDQLVDTLQTRLSEQIKDPTVTIQFMNFHITMLGAVRSPGKYRVNTERVSVLDAIGMAGDLPLKSKRKNVLVVRDKGGEVQHGRLNLTSASIFNSEFFYLQQNDVVYVEPSRSGIQDGTTSSFLPYMFSILSSAIALVAIFVR
ncbi:MAG: polysaccharide biosynthesis/export family protein [Bacteroidales bacterium]